MVKGTILGVDPNEVVLHEVKRNPIGIYFIYATSAVLLVLLLAGVFLIAGASSGNTGFLTIVALAVSILIVLFAALAVSVYKTNELVVTNENLVQILQHSLFDRKVSQLNLAKVQDVTVDQDGFLPTLFSYGTINIETAGEASNYRFPYASNPTIIAKHIIEAHEQYIRTHQIDGQAQVRARSIRPGAL